MLFYLSLTKLAWAESADPDLMDKCLGSTFDSWMGLFSSMIQTQSVKLIGIKMQVFRVAFTDSDTRSHL